MSQEQRNRVRAPVKANEVSVRGVDLGEQALVLCAPPVWTLCNRKAVRIRFDESRQAHLKRSIRAAIRELHLRATRCGLPARELPDLRKAGTFVAADLGKGGHRSFEVNHRILGTPGRVMDVGEVVLERGFAMAIAVGGA